MDDSITAALYARVSSQRQADELTIESQIDALRRRIEQDGLTIDQELCFLDEGYTGATLVRPALERLRDVAQCAGFDRLYVHSPDRLARKYAWQVVLLEEFNKQDVEVVFLNHDPQNQSPEGDLLLQMQGMIAEYERAKILERTRRGRRFKARLGKVSVIGHAPYGYRYVTKHQGDGEARWDIDLEQASVVKEIFAWVGVEGLSLADVTRRLEQRAIPTATGKARWDPATIRGILLNPAYMGTAKYGKTRLVPRQTTRRPKRGDPRVPRQVKVARVTSPDEQESIAVPALISRELFAAVGETLAANRRRYREQKKGTEFLLSGLLICHVCGSAYCGRRQRFRSGREYSYYRCIGTDTYRHGGEAICANKGVNGSLLEQSVWADVCSLLKDHGRLRREFERRLAKPAKDVAESGRPERSIPQLKQRIARLIDAYEEGSLTKEEFEPRIRRAKDRLAREQAALTSQTEKEAEQEELRLLIGEFEAFASRISEGLDRADFATRRKLLRLLVKQIEVDRDEVRIVYKVEPPPFVRGPVSRGRFLQHCLKFR